MSRLIPWLIIAGLALLLWQRMAPAPPAEVRIDPGAVQRVALGALHAANRQELARQRVNVQIPASAVPVGGWPAWVGLREDYLVVAIGEVVAAIDLADLPPDAVTVGPSGAMVLTLPAPTLTATLDLAQTRIEHAGGWLPMADNDRLAVLRGAEAPARAAMIEAAGPGALALARAEAARYYRDLLAAVGLQDVTVTIKE